MKHNYTFFNEEWNMPEWEDSVDEYPTQKRYPTITIIED